MVKLAEAEEQMLVVDLNGSLDELPPYNSCGICDHQARSILHETYEQMGMGDEAETIRVINHPMYQCLKRGCGEISYPPSSDIDFDRRIAIRLKKMGKMEGAEHFKSLALKHEIHNALEKFPADKFSPYTFANIRNTLNREYGLPHW